MELTYCAFRKIFWSDWGFKHTNQSTLNGKINSMPLHGGETELLIKSPNKPDSLALDDERTYQIELPYRKFSLLYIYTKQTFSYWFRFIS